MAVIPSAKALKPGNRRGTVLPARPHPGTAMNAKRLLLLCSLLSPGSAAAAPPAIAQGVQLGIGGDRDYLLWSRSDRPARLHVRWADNPELAHARERVSAPARAADDWTVRIPLRGLPRGRDIFYRAWFATGSRAGDDSEVVTGRFHTVGDADDIHFVWGADTGGQGWGINEAAGGYRIYTAMLRTQADFFIHNGDTIYADAPIPAEKPAENGHTWINLTTPETGKVAETLAEYRGRYRYNLLDRNLLAFNREVPQIWQWDDHEVANNWSTAKDLTADPRYRVKDLDSLLRNAARAYREYAPIDWQAQGKARRLYRKLAFGGLLEVFVLDMRSYRGPNSYNLQRTPGPDTAFLGDAQLRWLQQGLAASAATWKVIAADMPLGVDVGDGKDALGLPRWEAVANGDNGPAAGRELEIQELLRFIKARQIRNIVWLTGDVHYAAAHYYDPAKAASPDFLPFWEFVAGPLHAVTGNAGIMDATFGPQVVFSQATPAGVPGYSPLMGYQFFGEVNIGRRDGNMTVGLRDMEGKLLFSRVLAAE